MAEDEVVARRRAADRIATVAALIAFVLIAAGVVGSLSGVAGSALRNGADYACLKDSAVTPEFEGDHLPESVSAEGAWSLVPIGVECAFIATDTGERVIMHPSPWPSLLIVGGALIGCFTGILSRRRRRSEALRAID